MVKISDFPLEIVARVFKELDLENAWTARQVCRHWRDVFEFCAYGSKNVYLRGISVGVDIICGIHSGKGKVLDRHIIHGQLEFDSSKGVRRLAKWSPTEECYEVWPGGRWRKYTICDVLTDVNLRISNLPSNQPDIIVNLGKDATLVGDVTHGAGNAQKGMGLFSQFIISIDTLEEPSCNGRSYHKHFIAGLIAPLWQIYALIVHNSRIHRAEMEIIRRHYVQTSSLFHATALKKMNQDDWKGFGGFYSEAEEVLDESDYSYY